MLSCAANHANNLAHAGRYEEALRLTRDAYERSVRVRVPNHPNTLLLVANLVLDLVARDEHTEAAQLRKTTIENLRQVLGPEHPETINVERGRRAEIDIEVASL